MLHFFFPQVLEERTSPINGHIEVVKFQGKISIYVDKTQQSGPWVKKVWSKIPLSGKNVLILGLGAGTIVPLICGDVTGVEIDPVMVELGDKYFPSKKDVIIGDAFDYVSKVKRHFDLIIVDVYLGKIFPKKFESASFFQKLSQTLSKDGLVIFNRLTTKSTNFELKKFLDNLEKYFKIQETRRVDFNTFIICSRREKH